MEYRVLGPLTAAQGGEARTLGGPRQRMVLALLLADPNRVVSQDALIEAVWSSEPPEAAKSTLHSYVSTLRKQLGGEIIRDGDGYRVAVDDDSLDALRFERLVALGKGALQTAPEEALATLRTALAMWHGLPYGDLGMAPALSAEVARLGELRLTAVESRIEADLAVGNHTVVVGELASIIRENPYREHLRSLHMLALYRSGRQAEALRAFQRARALLGEELGIDPSLELRTLEQRILEQDPELDLPVPVRVGRQDAGSSPGPGRSVRGYELREQVGQGTVGVVFRAFQPSVGREVVVKVVRPELADRPEFLRHFEADARLVADLDHPHVVPLFDYWREPGGAYLVMPLLRGGSLDESLRRGPWKLASTLQLLEQVGGAVGHAHRRGVVHGDIEPGNVFLDGEGNAYLSGFGIGMGTTAATSPAAGATAPPAEATWDRVATARTDVAALGSLTFQLLTGVDPGSRRPLPSITEARPELPADLDGVLRRATAEHPADGYDKVEDFLRAFRQTLGADVVDVAGPSRVPAEPTALRNPYKGLRSFLEGDSADFHGRDTLVDEILSAIATHPLVAVVGPSGSGKSSVVRAGVIPQLRAGALPGGAEWLITDMFPGAHPFEELGAALLRVAVKRPDAVIEDLGSDERALLRTCKEVLPDDNSRLLLVIDQFEELFSAVAAEETRRLFLDSLVALATEGQGKVCVVVTLRADFFDRPLDHLDFGGLITSGLVTVGPPSEEGLAQAIAGPARGAGVDLEPGLVGEIVRDVAGQPGGLPLLQYALTELFERREGNVLTTDGYRLTGGVVGALGRRADELYTALTPAGKEAARQLLLRLVTVDERADVTRRRVQLTELKSLAVDQRALDAALHQFGSFRLLAYDHDPITRGPTVEVAHEALLSEWHRLAAWVEGEREDLIQRRRISGSAREWIDSDRDPSFLLRGGRLERAEQWAEGTHLAASREEAEFLATSRELHAAEERDAKRRRLTRTSLLAGGLVVALVLAGWAVRQRETALREERETTVRALSIASAGVVGDDPELAVLLAAEAVGMAQRSGDQVSPEAMSSLNRAVQNSRLEARVEGSGGAIALSPDGSRLASASPTEITVHDLRTGTTAWARVTEFEPTGLAFSPDGESLAVVHRPLDRRDRPPLLVLDAGSGEEISRMALPVPIRGHVRVRWNASGDRVAALTPTVLVLGAVPTGHVQTLDLGGVDVAAGGEGDVAFGGEGTVVVARPQGDRTVVHDVARGGESEARHIPTRSTGGLAIDPLGGKMLVSDGTTIEAWNLRAGALLWSTGLPPPIVAPSIEMEISSAAGLVAVSAGQEAVSLIDLDDGTWVRDLPAQAAIAGLAFDDLGRRLASAVRDGETLVWDTTPAGPLTTGLGVEPPCDVRLSPDGTRVVTTGDDGTVQVTDLESSRVVWALPDEGVGYFNHVVVSPDWRLMAWGGGGIRDGMTGEQVFELPACAVPKAFSPDGSLLVLNDRCEGRLLVVDPLTGEQVLDLGAGDVFGAGAAFTPSGDHLVVNLNEVVKVYDMVTLEPVASVTPERGSTAVTLDPSGTHLAIVTGAGRALVLDLPALVGGVPLEEATVADLNIGREGWGVALDDEGRLTVSSHGRLELWNSRSGVSLDAPPVALDTPPFAAFAPDGRVLYADRVDGGGYVLRQLVLDPAELEEIAADRVTRGLSEDECRRHLGADRCTSVAAPS